jgi:hypothetical protein
LPSEETFDTNGKEWLLHLLSKTPKDMRPKILFLLWRAWHHRNNIVHGDGKASVSASVGFLANYLGSFSAIHSKPTCDIGTSWIPPEPGSLKANVDAGWDAHSRDAGIMIQILKFMNKFLKICLIFFIKFKRC